MKLVWRRLGIFTLSFVCLFGLFSVDFAVADGAVGNAIKKFLHEFVVNVFGWLVAASGALFDMSVSRLVTGFASTYSTTGVGVSIENIWGIVRDVLNLTFIFGIIYIGFRLILNAEDSGAKRNLAYLLAAALLINFSLFITKFIVDFSNLLAHEIFKAFASDTGIGQKFIEVMRLSSAFNKSNLEADVSFAYIIGLMILLLITSFVLLAGAVMIFMRFIGLVIYMMLSPIMFLGWIFPGMQGVSQKWWSGFLGKAFWAPAFMFMLYLSYRVLLGYGTGTALEDGNLANVFNADGADSVGALFYFVMGCSLMIASLVVANKMGATGASTAIAVGQRIRRSGQSWAGRNSIGWAGDKVGKGWEKFDARTKDSGTRRWANRGLNVATLGGWGAVVNDRNIKSVTGAAKTAKYGGSYSREDDVKYSKERKALQATTNSNLDLKKSLKTKFADGDVDSQIKFEQSITDATNDQIIDTLTDLKPEDTNYKRIVRAMSPTQFTKIMESKDDVFNPSQKSALAKARGDQVANKLTSAPLGSKPGTSGPDIRLAIQRDASDDDLTHLGLNRLRENAGYITASRMDDLKKKLSPTEWGILNEERKAKLQEMFDADTSSVFKMFDGSRKKDNEIARLPGAILKDPSAVYELSPKVLETIVRENYLDSDGRNQIRQNIIDGHLGDKYEKFFKTPLGLTF